MEYYTEAGPNLSAYDRELMEAFTHPMEASSDMPEFIDGAYGPEEISNFTLRGLFGRVAELHYGSVEDRFNPFENPEVVGRAGTTALAQTVEAPRPQTSNPDEYFALAA